MNQKQKTKEEQDLSLRQKVLLNFLNENFVSGKYFSIEEICANVVCPDGSKAYQLNTDPRQHDKCIALSQDVHAINYSFHYNKRIVVKDLKGGVKICESKQEFKEWRERELAPIERKCKYLNSIKFKAKQHGLFRIFNDNFEHKENIVEVFK